MAVGPIPAKSKVNWTQLGSQMMANKDYRSAVNAFKNAVRARKNDPVHRFHLALAHEAAGEFGQAAEQLTEALRMRPTMQDVARQLGFLVSRGTLPADVQLNRHGLMAALEFDSINREQIAEVAVHYLAQSGPLKAALDNGRGNGWRAAAQALCVKSTGELLKDALFLKSISDNITRMPELEKLLAALRKVLLIDLPRERFQDRALVRATIVLMRQCWFNEYIWTVKPEERDALASTSIDHDKLFSGDVDQGINVLIAGMYQPLPSVLGEDVALNQIKNIRPNAVRDIVLERVSEFHDERERARNTRSLGEISDETSVKVAAQYQDYPYPRWTSLGSLVDEEIWRQTLAEFFPEKRLSFMSEPHNVLIAGCGTGSQAIAASFAYGPTARVTAIDLSLASLAYAQRMAEKFGATNIEFMHADIGDLGRHPEFMNRFHVIECMGVLHHMAKPFDGWRTLMDALRDDGFMLIGLYSDLARKKWTALKDDPAFPGEDCDDDALRTFREDLFARSDDEVGAEFKGIRDLYMTSGFRDLILHVSEQRHTIEELAQFMVEHGINFRGFYYSQYFDMLRQRFPGEVWPGNLEKWTQLERDNPLLFANMYRFWCDKA